MATHDYVIANGTGAAVRSDLNNALAAIVSNNSSSSEPGTTYAYQWWADTNANVLKIRNSSNDGWITLRELDGTMLIPDGSAALPGLAFADDLNTGIYSGAANQIGFTTDGVERFKIQTAESVFNDPSNDINFRVESSTKSHMLFVDAGNDRVGINASAPARTLDVNGFIRSDGTDGGLSFGGNSSTPSEGASIHRPANNTLAFVTDSSERARIDSSGRLLVGATSSSADCGGVYEGSSSSAAAIVHLSRSSGVSNNSTLGALDFSDNAQNSYAQIKGAADAEPSGSSYPGRLLFLTTANGSTSLTERMRIDSSGVVKLTQSGNNPRFGSLEASGDAFKLKAFSNNSGQNASMQFFTGNHSPTERMRITSDGKIGIGHTTPQFAITIGQTANDSGKIGWEDASSNKRASITCSTSSDNLQFHTGTGDHERMSIQANGRVNMFQVYDTAIGGTTRDLFIEDGGQIGYVSSIRESKANISVLSDVDWIYQLQPSSFNFKLRDRDGEYTGEVSTELEYGLIAEDVEPIAPELCFYDEVDGEQELRGIHYKKLIVPILKALQEANAKITTLETKVAALEAG